MSKQVVVVGAGLSGLAAAYTLQEAGYAVRVLEQSEVPGGRVCTVRRKGYVIDTGADAMTAGYRSYLSLMNALGLRDRVVKSSLVMGIVRGDRVYDIDPTRIVAAAFTSALSWRGKLNLLRGAIKLRPQLDGIDSFDLVASADRDDPAVNSRDYVRGFFGNEVAEYLVDPAVRLTTGSGAQMASLLGSLGAAASWTSGMISVDGGLDVLPRALAERVPVRCRTEVTGVFETASRVKIDYRDTAGEQSTISDFCVISAMYAGAARMWKPLEQRNPQFAAELKNAQLISISLGYSAVCDSRAYALAVPTVENPDLLLAFLQHNKAPDRAPAGHSLITLYTDTLAFDRYDAKSDAEVEQWAVSIVERIFPELKGRRDLCEITRWAQAGYLATPGFWRRSRELLRSLPENGRVQLAGDLFGAGSMESAVRWGARAADNIITNDRALAGEDLTVYKTSTCS